MKVEIIKNVPKELWDEIIDKSDHATFYHTYTWSKILEKSYLGWKDCTRAFMFDDGTKAILPLMNRRSIPGMKRLFQIYQSMVPGVYGGIISNKQLNQDKINKIVENIIRLTGIQTARVILTCNPLNDNMTALQSFKKKPMFTLFPID